MFGDPEDYSHLSEEERQNKTDKMLAKHKVWSKNPFNNQTKGL